MKKHENKLFDYQLLTGDCLDGMAALNTGSIDTVITDPPFSSGGREATKTTRGSMLRSVSGDDWFGSDNLTINGFNYLMRSCALQWFRVLKDGGHVFVFIDWRMLYPLACAIESADFQFRGVLVWDKTYFGLGSHFRLQHEFIVHFSKNKPTKPLRRDVPNVLACKPVRGGAHPTEKPVELLSRILSVTTPPGGRVLDCFAGSGATGVAALLNGSSFVGIEREPRYIDHAINRLDNFFNEVN